MSPHLRNAIVVFSAAALLAGCSGTPSMAGAPASPIDRCSEINGEIERAKDARRLAREQQQAAWKAVIPVAVAVRYASGNSAAGNADGRLRQLRDEFARRGCDE